jgi:excisionase family DNA binding protein
MATIPYTKTPPLGVASTAAELGISRQAVRDLIRRGELPALRIGRAIRIRRCDLDAFTERALAAATAD